MDLRQYLQAIRKFWWVMLIPALLGGLSAVYSASQSIPQYQASVTFFVRTVGDTSANSQFAGDQFAQRRVNSYVALLSTDRLANAVVERSGLDLTPKQVSGMLGASGDVNTVLLTATVTSDSEEEASAVAAAVSVEFVRLVNEVENASGEAASVTLELVSGPNVVQLPSGNMTMLAMRVALGLILGLGLAVLLELRDTSVRSDDQLLQTGAGPILGRIPLDKSFASAPLVISSDLNSRRAEAFRQLRTNLQFLDVERPVKVLVVTSSIAEEGKSSTSANLALSMVAANRRVLVIEADFRRPKLADYFGVERGAGLTDALAGRIDVESVLQPWGTGGLVVLPSGPLPPNPSEMLNSEAMGRLLDRFRKEFDLVIIDTPPILPVTDGAVAAARADGTLLVVRSGRTSRHQLSSAVRSLEAVGARVLGSVFSMVPPSRTGYSAYSYEPPPGAPARPMDPTRGRQQSDDLPAWSEPATRTNGAPPLRKAPATTRDETAS